MQRHKTNGEYGTKVNMNHTHQRENRSCARRLAPGVFVLSERRQFPPVAALSFVPAGVKRRVPSARYGVQIKEFVDCSSLIPRSLNAVSYTHLDVYKRQGVCGSYSLWSRIPH